MLVFASIVLIASASVSAQQSTDQPIKAYYLKNVSLDLSTPYETFLEQYVSTNETVRYDFEWFADAVGAALAGCKASMNEANTRMEIFLENVESKKAPPPCRSELRAVAAGLGERAAAAADADAVEHLQYLRGLRVVLDMHLEVIQGYLSRFSAHNCTASCENDPQVLNLKSWIIEEIHRVREDIFYCTPTYKDIVKHLHLALEQTRVQLEVDQEAAKRKFRGCALQRNGGEQDNLERPPRLFIEYKGKWYPASQ